MSAVRSIPLLLRFAKTVFTADLRSDQHSTEVEVCTIEDYVLKGIKRLGMKLDTQSIMELCNLDRDTIVPATICPTLSAPASIRGGRHAPSGSSGSSAEQRIDGGARRGARRTRAPSDRY